MRANEPRQNLEEVRVGNSIEGRDLSRGIVTRRVLHLEKEMDQMKKSHGRDEGFMGKTHHMDDLVHRIDSPFMASITSHPLPSKFKMPTLDFYDGTRYPCDQISTFKITMHLQGVLDEIMCRAFPITLKGLARVWFGKLPPNTITSFKELSKLFINNFIEGQQYK